MKNIQIPEELFIRLYGYFLLNKRDALQERIIIDQLQIKMDRIQARADYISQSTGTREKQPFKQGCMTCNQQESED